MRATILPYADQGPWGCSPCDGQGEYCALSTASKVFLIFTTQLYQYFFFFFFFLFPLVSDKPEVFLLKYSQTVILHTAHFRRVVTTDYFPSPLLSLMILMIRSAPWASISSRVGLPDLQSYWPLLSLRYCRPTFMNPWTCVL